MSRAGNNVRNGTETADDLAVIDAWRAAHRAVLNTFQALLRGRTRGTNIVVAQRHKRRTTIFGKLRRYPKMQLGRMDDVAGCRLIFINVPALYSFRAKIHAGYFNHVLKNDVDKYDYIKSPKPTGYRGVHDVYEYDVRSVAGQNYKGLLIELQYRTLVQHAWATTVEVVGFITENQPKFQQGDKRYEEILRLASEILARAFEDSKSSLPELTDAEVVRQFVELDGELNFMHMLRGLNAADRDISNNRNVLLIFSPQEELRVMTYRDATEALRALFQLERENPGKDVVLVRGDTPEDVRIAFKNYFSDAREFIDLVDNGCKKLVRNKTIRLGGRMRRE